MKRGLKVELSVLNVQCFVVTTRAPMKRGLKGIVRSLTLLNEAFNLQEGFDLNEYITRGFGGMKNQPVQAVIRVDPPASRWVRVQKWQGLQKQIDLGNDQIEMHFDTEGRKGLMRQVLQWGGCAEMVAPPNFRAEIAQEITKMTKKIREPLKKTIKILITDMF